MDISSIRAIIAQKLAGQGNQVDLGSALPNILNDIMDFSASKQEVDDFKEFAPETSYAEGDIVRKDGKLYKFTTNHDGEWDIADVEQTNVMELLSIPEEPISTINVKIYKYVWNEDNGWEREDDSASGILEVKGFKGVETIEARQISFTNGVASFGFPTGGTFGVTAKIADYGASIQFVNVAVGEEINVELEVYPVGIYEMGDGNLSANLQHTGDMYQGCVVVSEDFAFLIPPYQPDNLKGEEDYLQWGCMFQNIPFLTECETSAEAIADFDGALNTRAILSLTNEDEIAAREATRNKDYYTVRYGNFLPSGGQLKYLSDHKTTINDFIQGAIDEYSPEEDYHKLNDRTYWSSTARNSFYSWSVYLGDGRFTNDMRFSSKFVLGVSAFQTLY